MNEIAGPRPHQFRWLAGWWALSIAAGAVGAVATADAGSFYASLDRPLWAPPSWLFGPAWSVLYVAMAVAAWLVWRSPGDSALRRTALQLFAAQLALNALWSWLFFAWNRGGAAFIEILLLWGLIAATLVAFWRIKPAAGILMLPYLCWVTFASVLNWALWRANPGILG